MEVWPTLWAASSLIRIWLVRNFVYIAAIINDYVAICFDVVNGFKLTEPLFQILSLDHVPVCMRALEPSHKLYVSAYVWEQVDEW